MRPTYYESSDTLQRDRLPEGTLAMDYRPRLPNGAAAITAAALLAIVLLSLLFTLAIRVSGFLLTAPVITIFVIAGPVTAAVLLIQRRPLAIVLSASLVGASSWSVMAILHAASSPRLLYFVGFGGVLAGLVWMGDTLAGHFARWMAASPRYRDGTRQWFEQLWKRRWNFRQHRRAAMLIASVYAFGALLFLIPTPQSIPVPLRAATVMLLVTILLVAATTWNFSRSGPAAGPCALFHPVVHWFTYSPHPFALGVLRIPILSRFGPLAVSRQVLTGVMLFLITASMSAAACYYPLSMVLTSRWHAMAELPRNGVPQPPTTEEVALALSKSDQRALAHMPREHRLRYLELLARREHLNRIGLAQQQARDDLLAHIDSSPEAWWPVIARQTPTSPTLVLWTLFISLGLCVSCSMAVFLSVILLFTHPLLVRLDRILVHRLQHDTEWDGYVHRIQSSRHATERESVWVGLHADADYPVLLHRSILREHAHILGDTGSGKTAMALAPMATQLIRMAGRDARMPADRDNPHSSVVIIDLKGDLTLFHGARIEAEQAGLPFQWFTDSLHRSTYVFNPFQQHHFSQLSLNQRTEVLVDALALHHGEGYGRSYFSRVNRRVLSRLLHAYSKRIHSFRDLYIHANKRDILGKLFQFTNKEIDDAGELLAMLENLASFEALNRSNPTLDEHRIDMYQTATRPQVVYFYLQSAMETASVREIGKLVVYCLLSAAAHRGHANHLVYLMIDEFQQLASTNLELILRQARSMGIATVLANQTISDLSTPHSNLIHTVQANTRFKQFFASTDLRQQDDIMKASGETIDYVQHWVNNGRDEPASEVETVQPRLTRNDIIRATDHPDLSIMHIPRGKGCAQMGGFSFVARSQFHIPESKYHDRERMPWPDAVPGTLVPHTHWMYDADSPEVQITRSESSKGNRRRKRSLPIEQPPICTVDSGPQPELDLDVGNAPSPHLPPAAPSSATEISNVPMAVMPAVEPEPTIDRTEETELQEADDSPAAQPTLFDKRLAELDLKRRERDEIQRQRNRKSDETNEADHE